MVKSDRSTFTSRI